MVIVRIFGGLGNQMFQYAFGYYLEKNGNDVYYDTSDFLIHNHHHGYELESVFHLFVKKASNREVLKLCGNKKSVFFRAFRKITGLEIIGRKEIVSNDSCIYILPKRLKEPLYFNGFWQNINYVKPFINDLKEIFKFSALNEINNDFISAKVNCSYVGVHVRRGDYLNDKNISSICDFNYYKLAIKYISERIENPKYIIFSDDIPWCKTVFKEYDCVYVDWNKGKDSYRDMQLMSLCDHMITANSTFSWWGAMLMQNEDGIRITPSVRSKNEAFNTLIDDSWVTIDTKDRLNG